MIQDIKIFHAPSSFTLDLVADASESVRIDPRRYLREIDLALRRAHLDHLDVGHLGLGGLYLSAGTIGISDGKAPRGEEARDA